MASQPSLICKSQAPEHGSDHISIQSTSHPAPEHGSSHTNVSSARHSVTLTIGAIICSSHVTGLGRPAVRISVGAMGHGWKDSAYRTPYRPAQERMGILVV